MGRAITELLAANSKNQIYFTFARSKAAAGEIEARFPNARAVPCDFTEPASISDLLAQIDDWNLDVLVHNALTGYEQKHFHKMPASEFVEGFQRNVLPVIQITQKVLPSFRSRKFGKIVTVLTSYLAGNPPTGLSEYVAAKSYLRSLAKSWAVENAAFNISSTCVSPSLMQTGLTAEVDSRVLEQLTAAQPFKKLVTTDETAEVVKFLVEGSQQLSGANIVVNGGENVI